MYFTRRKQEQKRKYAWKHIFVCLAYEDQQIPVREAEKDKLFAAGLDEKEIEFDDLCTSADIFCTKLFHNYGMKEDVNCQNAYQIPTN